jgi:transcriptional regulator with XRE-family HTH domain
LSSPYVTRISVGMTWFARALKRYMDAHKMTQVQLASYLGESQENISRWMSGSVPRDSDKVEAVLRRIGGDIERAMPDYDPVVDAMRKMKEELSVIRVGGPVFRSDSRVESLADTAARYVALKEWERDQAEEGKRKADKSASLAAEMEDLLRRFKEGREI